MWTKKIRNGRLPPPSPSHTQIATIGINHGWNRGTLADKPCGGFIISRDL